MRKPLAFYHEHLAMAMEHLQRSGAEIHTADIESLAESIASAINDWFGDMKHLTQKP